MKIIIPGGTGQVGTLLARSFHARGDEVVVLSRAPMSAPWRTVQWDAATVGPWARELEGADVIINLAGRNVNCRYTPANRRAIIESRVRSTRAVGAAIARTERPPRIWLQASTATIYAHRHDAPNDEATGMIGGAEPDAPASWRFSIEVARAWEEAALAAHTPQTRTVLLRSAMVMSPDRGGIFDTLLRLVRFGLGGPAGDGRQYVSWLHDEDFVRAVDWLIAHDELSGPVNLAAPSPLPYGAFMRALRQAWGMPVGLPATRWMVELGAWLLRTESELPLKSRRVVPTRLLQSGFAFHWPTWPEAAQDLCRRWRRSSSPFNPSLEEPAPEEGNAFGKAPPPQASGKEARFARDVNHTISKLVVREAQRTKRGIALENLKQIRTRVRARKSQRTVLHSWSFFQLLAFIAYKAQQAGVRVVLVDPRNTSRTCPACGHIDKASRPSQAVFRCTSCGCAGHADVIAAENIRVLGRAVVMQPNVSEAARPSRQRQAAGL